MRTQEERDDVAIIALPKWLWNNNPAEFAARSGWHAEQVSPGSREWKIRLRRPDEGGESKLISVTKVADAENFANIRSFEILQTLVTPPGINPPDWHRIQAEVERIGRERPNDIAAAMYAALLATQNIPDEELADQVQDVLRNSIEALPDMECYLISFSPEIALRYTAVRMLLQTEDDPALLTQPPAAGDDSMIFSSGRWLFTDTSFGFAAYLAPLFTSLSPWVWAVPVPRHGGVIVYSFGQALVGRRSEAPELLQLFLPIGRLSVSMPPAIGPSDIEKALHWWTEHLDELFREITDPVRYRHGDGTFDPVRNFETLLTFEQVFRNAQVLAANDRDPQSRRMLLFDLLDSIAGIRSPNFDQMCEVATAEGALAEVMEVLDDGAASVLIPRAQLGRDALEKVQEGFFLPSRVNDAGVRVPNRDGTERVMSRAAAAAQYLRVLRNSGHAFGSSGRRQSGQARDQALLISHNGNLPHDLPDLAYLYLLRLLARPGDLRRRM